MSQANRFRLLSWAALWLRASEGRLPILHLERYSFNAETWNMGCFIHDFNWFHTFSYFWTPFWFVSKVVGNRLRLRPMEMFFFRTGDMLPLVTLSVRTTSDGPGYWTFLMWDKLIGIIQVTSSNFDSMTETAFLHCFLNGCFFAFSHFCHQC